jgi:hypothetical protein
MFGRRVIETVNWAHPGNTRASLHKPLPTFSHWFHTASKVRTVFHPQHSPELSSWRNTRKLQRRISIHCPSYNPSGNLSLNLLTPVMSLRRSHSSQTTEKSSLSTNGFASHKHEGNGDHSDSVFSSHSHSHGEGHGHGAEKIMEAIQGSGMLLQFISAD